MKTKLIGIIICMLFLVPAVSTSTIAYQESDLEIKIYRPHEYIFRSILYIEIRNNGEDDEHDITWNLSVKHLWFNFLKLPLLEDTIDLIKAGESEVISVSFAWLGFVKITATANVPFGEQVSKRVIGFGLFHYLFIFPDL